MDNTATRKDIRRKEKAERVSDKERGIVILDLMSGRSGRAYVWADLEAAHVFTTSYSPDALAMAFAEGERNSGLRLLNEIMQWCPEQFIQMMREQNERRILADDNRSGADARSDAESFPDGDEPDPGHDVYG